jgi:hypothetical protein
MSIIDVTTRSSVRSLGAGFIHVTFTNDFGQLVIRIQNALPQNEHIEQLRFYEQPVALAMMTYITANPNGGFLRGLNPLFLTTRTSLVEFYVDFADTAANRTTMRNFANRLLSIWTSVYRVTACLQGGRREWVTQTRN